MAKVREADVRGPTTKQRSTHQIVGEVDGGPVAKEGEDGGRVILDLEPLLSPLAGNLVDAGSVAMLEGRVGDALDVDEAKHTGADGEEGLGCRVRCSCAKCQIGNSKNGCEDC